MKTIPAISISFFIGCGSLIAQDLADFPTEGLLACYPLDGDLKDISGNEKHGSVQFSPYAMSKNASGSPQDPQYGEDRFGRKGFACDITATQIMSSGGPVMPLNINPSVHKEVTMACWAKLNLSESFLRTLNLKGNAMQRVAGLTVFSTENMGWDRGLAWINHRGRGQPAQPFGWTTTRGPGHGPLKSNNYSTSEWTFLAVVFGANETVLYVGDKIYRAQCSHSEGTDVLWIGQNPRYDNTPCDGQIDDFFVYNRALDADEITAIRRQGASWIQEKKPGSGGISLPKKMFVTTSAGKNVEVTVTAINEASIQATLASGKTRKIAYEELSPEDRETFRQYYGATKKSTGSKQLTAVVYNGVVKNLVQFSGQSIKIDVTDALSSKTLHLDSLQSEEMASLTVVTTAAKEKSYFNPDGSLFYSGSLNARVSVIDAYDEDQKEIKALYLRDDDDCRLIHPDGSVIFDSSEGVPFWQVKVYGEDGNISDVAILEWNSTFSTYHHPDGRKIKIHGWFCHEEASPDGISVLKGGKYGWLGYDGTLLIPPLYKTPVKYLGNKQYRVERNEETKTITLN